MPGRRCIRRYLLSLARNRDAADEDPVLGLPPPPVAAASAGTGGRRQEPQHPPPVPPVNARMLAAAVTLNAIRAKRMPTCLIIIPPKYEATSWYIGKHIGIF